MSKITTIILSIAGLILGVSSFVLTFYLPNDPNLVQPEAIWFLYFFSGAGLLGAFAGLVSWGRSVTTRLFGATIFVAITVFQLFMLFTPPKDDEENPRLRRRGGGPFIIMLQVGCGYMAITGKFGIDFTGSKQPEEKQTRRRKKRKKKRAPDLGVVNTILKEEPPTRSRTRQRKRRLKPLEESPAPRAQHPRTQRRVKRKRPQQDDWFDD